MNVNSTTQAFSNFIKYRGSKFIYIYYFFYCFKNCLHFIRLFIIIFSRKIGVLCLYTLELLKEYSYHSQLIPIMNS
jgi:hypothetical protein